MIRKIKGEIVWITIILVVLVAAGWYYFFKASPSVQGGTSSIQGQTAVARRGNLVVSASGSGRLITQTSATFGFESNGQVFQVNVKVGDQVEAGQVLAQLDNTLVEMKYSEAQQALRELYSAASIASVQLEIATAEKDKSAARDWLGYLLSPQVIDAEEILAASQQKLADAQTAARANPSNAADQQVKQQEKTVAYFKDKLTQAQYYYENVYLPDNFTQHERQGRRQVVMTYTDPTTGKQLPLIDRPSTADIAKARNNYAQAIQTIKEGELYLDVLNTGIIPESAIGGKLSNLYLVQQELKDAQSALDATRLIAPISGTVTLFDVRVGEQAGTASAVTISQLSQPYAVDASLDELDWNSAKIGNKVSVTFDLLPEQTFPGTVKTVYPALVASNDSALVHIVVQLDKRISQNLPAGTGATLSVVGGEANGIVVVPVNAVHKTDSGYAVTVIQNGSQMERKVEIGLQNKSFIEIKAGLDAGEIVVTN